MKKYIFIIILIVIVTTNLFAARFTFDPISTQGNISKMDVAVSTPHIEGWSDDRQMSSVNSGGAIGIANDMNGMHLVLGGFLAVNDNTYKIYYRKSIDNAKTWTTEKTLTIFNTIYCRGAEFISFNNTLCLVWSDARSGNFEVYLKMSKDGGDTWSADKIISSDHYNAIYPSICADSTTLYVVFADSPTGSYKLYMTTSTDNGNTWCVPYSLSTPSFFCSNSNILCKNDILHLFWTDYRNGKTQIYYKRSINNGNAWTPDTNIINSTGNANYSSVAIDNNGIIHLFYCDDYQYPSSQEYTYEIYCKRSEDGGLTWSSSQRLTDLDSHWSSISGNPVVDSNGLHIFWSDSKYNGYTEVNYLNSPDYGITWGKEQRLTYYAPPFAFGAGSGKGISINNVLNLIFGAVIDDDYTLYKFYDPTLPTGKPGKPFIETYSSANKTIKWSWTKGDVADLESYFEKYGGQIWKTPGTIEDIAGEGGNGLTVADADMGVSYRMRVRARTETYRYTDWSDWSDPIAVQSTLSNFMVYPNPFKSGTNSKVITFANLSNDPTVIRIFNISGELVRILTKDVNMDKIEWDLKNEHGNRVSSGIYLYKINNFLDPQYPVMWNGSSSRSHVGKIAVVF
ncbi:MAG: hypothetical protein A3J83_04565 [Elusimicrobia bacterium RIFOXYA2_FULL_40_6]|nr:MAG: hypothetical protein A3J83_04565 [Elusimicrobia bacterium RIFOXYA2_FULL_40_6]